MQNKKFLVAASFVFAVKFFFSGIGGAFADSRILSPIPGTFCNRQPLVIDLSDGAECFYSLTGSSPLDSGLAYDGPFLIDATGDVELSLVVIKEKEIENYRISYKVEPLADRELKDYLEISDGKGGTKAVLNREAEFLRKVTQNPIQEIFSDETFVIPSGFKYSFDNEVEPYLDGTTLSLDRRNKFFRYLPVTCSFEDKMLHFILKIAGTEAGTLSKKDIPFEIEDWTNIKFTGKRLIWSVDGGLWSASDKSFYLDRSVPHVISWQDVAYEAGNPISRYTLPVVPTIEMTGGGRDRAKFVLKGDNSYRMEVVSGGEGICTGENNGLFSEISIDTFEGDAIDGKAVFAVYSDGVYHGNISIPYVIDKKSPRAPKIISSTSEYSFSRETVNLEIEGEYGSRIFYAVSDVVTVDKDNLKEATESGYLDSIEVGEFKPYDNGLIYLNAGTSGAVFYKVASYAEDRYGNMSATSTFSIIIDENNFYLAEKIDDGASVGGKTSLGGDFENGSYLAPFSSLDKILKIVNSGKFTRVYVSGVIEVTGGEKKITSNCEFIATKDARLVFSPNSSLRVSAAAANFSGIVFEKRKDVLGISNTGSFLTFENATGEFKDCEIVGVFADGGTALESLTSILNLENSRVTAAGDSYVAGISASRSKISLKDSRFSTVASTSVNFSVSNSVFEVAKCDCKVSGRLGRIAELNATEVKMRENIFGAEMERSGRPSAIEAIWKDEKTKIYEYLENKIYGF